MSRVNEMDIYLTTLGIIEVKDGKKQFKPYSKDPNELGKLKYLIEKGNNEAIQKIINKYKKAPLKVLNPILYNVLTKKGLTVEWIKEGEFNLIDLLKESRIVNTIDDALAFLSNTLSAYTTEKLKDEMTNKDLLIIHAINAYDEYTEMINILYERLREWYGVYFPELKDYIKKLDRYTSLVHDFLSRDEFTVDKLLERGYPKEKAMEISNAAANSTGGMLSREDLQMIKQHAEKTLELIKLRDEVDEYLRTLLEEEAPNLSRLIGHKLAARLIAKAGGIRKLATLPSSTIQLLGAEKSLFLALRKGGKPPKHGIIFQHPFINQSPKVIRGRVARLLAGKIAIAARVDAFGGEFVGDKLYEEVSKRVEVLKKEAPKLLEKKRVLYRKMKKKRKRKKRRR